MSHPSTALFGMSGGVISAASAASRRLNDNDARRTSSTTRRGYVGDDGATKKKKMFGVGGGGGGGGVGGALVHRRPSSGGRVVVVSSLSTRRDDSVLVAASRRRHNHRNIPRRASSSPSLRITAAAASVSDEGEGITVKSEDVDAIKDAVADADADDALGALLATVTDAGTPFALSDPVALSPDVVYRLEPGVAPDGGALWSCAGAREYSNVAKRWRRTMRDELWECEQRVTRCSRTGPDEAVVRWETQYIPAKLRWLWDLGQAWPGVRVTTYDILDRMGEISRFSWRGLFMLFFRAATQGEMRLPAALVQGTSRLRFREGGDGSDGDISSSGGGGGGGVSDGRGGGLVLVSHEETLDLVVWKR